ncbi:hypothetical protein [Dyella dinghuensis]|uniref:hypothetical protein n=1 Tax=Dyella dinghuensis TaxID=1920169 RepID=UPI001315AACC|nr:hypothetical protein [Dyella dinghuensis]
MTVRNLIAKNAVAMSTVRARSPAASIVASPFLLRRPHPRSRWLFCGYVAAIAPNSNDQT